MEKQFFLRYENNGCINYFNLRYLRFQNVHDSDQLQKNVIFQIYQKYIESRLELKDISINDINIEPIFIKGLERTVASTSGTWNNIIKYKYEKKYIRLDRIESISITRDGSESRFIFKNQGNKTYFLEENNIEAFSAYLETHCLN